ncbi:hypothetical protein Murka_0081 [Xanthomonas phage Murka]|nr:hypothetical protein Murka_0081 [Xanthomonas phage Murka]
MARSSVFQHGLLMLAMKSLAFRRFRRSLHLRWRWIG